MERYLVSSLVGQGSFGCVYKAQRRIDDKVVAIKVISKVGFSYNIPSKERQMQQVNTNELYNCSEVVPIVSLRICVANVTSRRASSIPMSLKWLSRSNPNSICLWSRSLR